MNEICRNVSILRSCRHVFYIFAVQFDCCCVNMFFAKLSHRCHSSATMADNLRSCAYLVHTKQSENGNDDELIVLERYTNTHSLAFTIQECHMCMKFDWEMDKGARQCESGKKLGHHISK